MKDQILEPFYELIRGVNRNKERSLTHSEITGILIYSFYWEVKGFFQDRPALIDAKICLHEYISSVPKPLQMETASCLMNELSRLKGVIKRLGSDQETYLKANYPLLISGKVKTGEYLEQAEQFNLDRDEDHLLGNLSEILEYLNEIQKELKRLITDVFTSPDIETLEKHIQNGKTLDDFKANERRLYQEGLIDYECRWIAPKTLFQDYIVVITAYDYFKRTVKDTRQFFVNRYGDIGQQQMKPSSIKERDEEEAKKKFAWMRDQRVFKK